MAEIWNYVNNTKQFRTAIQRLIHRTCEWLVNEEIRMAGKQCGHFCRIWIFLAIKILSRFSGLWHFGRLSTCHITPHWGFKIA